MKGSIAITLCVVSIIAIIYILLVSPKYYMIELFTEESSGLSNFVDVVYYINLDHRIDRKERITSELDKVGLRNVERISAVYNKEHGGLGCSASHINTLKRFIESGKSRCLILEDDFVFSHNNDGIHSVLENIKTQPFDVLMLSGNVLNSEDVQNNKHIKRVINAQTASGYIVTREFAPTLLQNYEEGLALFRQHTNQYPIYALDQYWKKLQPISRWYIVNPSIGKQHESYSDIELRNVNYNV